MAFGNIESWIKAILLTSLIATVLSPIFYNTLPSTVANQLNITATNSTNNLNNLVFHQVNNTVFCGTASTSCSASNRTGGVYAQANLFSAFAFVLNGFGDLVTALVNSPYIMSVWIGESISIINLPVGSINVIQAELPAFIAFLLLMVCVSALMKYPLRSG